VKFKDYYEILGVKRDATEEQIRQAFRKLARKYHPDLNPGDKASEEKFKELNEANEVLSDADKRKRYDQLGATGKMGWNLRHRPAGAVGACRSTRTISDQSSVQAAVSAIFLSRCLAAVERLKPTRVAVAAARAVRMRKPRWKSRSKTRIVAGDIASRYRARASVRRAKGQAR